MADNHQHQNKKKGSGRACTPCRAPTEAELAQARVFLGPQLQTLKNQIAEAKALLCRQRKLHQKREKKTANHFEKLLLKTKALEVQYKVDMQDMMSSVKAREAENATRLHNLSSELQQSKANKARDLLKQDQAARTEATAAARLKQANNALVSPCMLCLVDIDARTSHSYGLCCSHSPVAVTGFVDMEDPSCSCTDACRSTLKVQGEVKSTMSKARLCTNCVVAFLVHNETNDRCLACNLQGTAQLVKIGALL